MVECEGFTLRLQTNISDSAGAEVVSNVSGGEEPVEIAVVMVLCVMLLLFHANNVSFVYF